MKYQGTLIAVTNMEKSKEFYQRVLSMKITADFGANVTLNDSVYLQTLPTWQSFINNEIDFGANTGELYFEEDDMDAFLKKLNSFKDIDYVHPVKEHAWGQHVVRFYDPDRHIIEVGENIAMVVRRFVDSGLSIEATAKRMDVPSDYVRECLRAGVESI